MPNAEMTAAMVSSPKVSRNHGERRNSPMISLTPRSLVGTGSSGGTPPSSKLSPAISTDMLAPYTTSSTIDYRRLYEAEVNESQRSRNEVSNLRKQLEVALEKLDHLEQRERENLVSSSALDRRERRNLECKVAEFEQKMQDYDKMQDEVAKLKEENTKLIFLITKLTEASVKDD